VLQIDEGHTEYSSKCLACFPREKQHTAGMMSFHTKAMHVLSSVSATAISMSVNILATGAASIIFFGELPTAGWLLGTVLLIVGTGLITAASVPAFDRDPRHKKKAA
jgi:drug/metabolite transporter (DMT)-like permease